MGVEFNLEDELGPKRVADLEATLAAFAEHPNIRLVLLDLRLPGMMSVEDFMESVRRLHTRQTVKFILASVQGRLRMGFRDRNVVSHP